MENDEYSTTAVGRPRPSEVVVLLRIWRDGGPERMEEDAVSTRLLVPACGAVAYLPALPLYFRNTIQLQGQGVCLPWAELAREREFHRSLIR